MGVRGLCSTPPHTKLSCVTRVDRIPPPPGLFIRHALIPYTYMKIEVEVEKRADTNKPQRIPRPFQISCEKASDFVRKDATCRV